MFQITPFFQVSPGASFTIHSEDHITAIKGRFKVTKSGLRITFGNRRDILIDDQDHFGYTDMNAQLAATDVGQSRRSNSPSVAIDPYSIKKDYRDGN